ncbi:MAG: hypothetical protein FD177_2334 [Desulfovibrionaceae bacterium]|nr:MAG: hypothetical protein FD177_2334 [Desulfovibrionaceae bacterium]
MDHASFALRQHLLVLHQAGIRHLLAAPAAPECVDTAKTCHPAGSVLDQQPWAGFLAKMPQGVQSVWTYEGLGQDFSGQPSAERRRTLGRLLASVRLPKGFVGFFPYCLPSGNALVQHQDVFLEALSHVNPSSVVLFADSQDTSLSRLLSGMDTSTVLLQVSSLDVLSRMSDDELNSEAATLRTSIFQGP